MNHAGSQELLLDLVYGELEPERAADVLAHAEGCEACRRELEQLGATLRLVAPLREPEQPSARLDARVMAAAHAEAALQSDGLVGQVIEASAKVETAGVQAGRIDASATVRASSARKPRWGLRAAMAGSAAAVLAMLFVAVQSKQTPPPRYAAEEYAVRIGRPVAEALPEGKIAGERPAPPPAAAPTEPQLAAIPKARHREVGAGGEVSASREVAGAQPAAAASPAQAAAPPQAAPRVEAPAEVLDAAKPAAEAKAAKAAFAPQSRPEPAPALESRAQEERRAANYAVAAALYRQAAAQRKGAGGDDSTAAWDLAHAVECLAAAGQLDAARSVRAELGTAYPAESGAFSAARRALREFGSEPPR